MNDEKNDAEILAEIETCSKVDIGSGKRNTQGKNVENRINVIKKTNKVLFVFFVLYRKIVITILQQIAEEKSSEASFKKGVM